MTALAFRPAIADDMPFVYGSWLSAYRPSYAGGPVPAHLYADVYTSAIGFLLVRPTCSLVVAYKPGEVPGLADLYGFICAEPSTARGPVVHFVYVRDSQRDEGIASGLFDELGIDPLRPFVFTYKTPALSDLRSKIPRARYNPLCARFATAWPEDRQETR